MQSSIKLKLIKESAVFFQIHEKCCWHFTRIKRYYYDQFKKNLELEIVNEHVHAEDLSALDDVLKHEIDEMFPESMKNEESFDTLHEAQNLLFSNFNLREAIFNLNHGKYAIFYTRSSQHLS